MSLRPFGVSCPGLGLNGLKRLGTDYINLYQIHRSDPEADIEETFIALTDPVQVGKVRCIGCSDMEAWELMQALRVSD